MGAGSIFWRISPVGDWMSLADVGRDDPAVVGQRRVHDRQLQRRDLNVALADGGVDVVTDRPVGGVGDAATSGDDLLAEPLSDDLGRLLLMPRVRTGRCVAPPAPPSTAP